MRYTYYKNIFTEYEDSYHQLEQLQQFLDHYNLSTYYDRFVQEGFDRIQSLLDITESDLISLSVKRGHRRLLQRAIATARGVPLSVPIIINFGYDEPVISHTPKPGTSAVSIPTPMETVIITTAVPETPDHGYNNGSNNCNNDNHGSNDNYGNDVNNNNNEYLFMDDYYSPSYRRHRKRKQYVPTKPLTAFDELIHEVQSQHSDMDHSDVTDIANQVWNNLTFVEKEKYEREALHANADCVMD